MKHSKKEELLNLFSISLALIACSVMVYMLRSPSISGNAVLQDSSSTSIVVVSILILAGIAILIGAIIVINKLKKETEQHKAALFEKQIVEQNPSLELASYIIKAKQAGFSDKQILDKLKKENWKEKEIRNFL